MPKRPPPATLCSTTPRSTASTRRITRSGARRKAKKFQDNGRTGGYNDLAGGKDRIVYRLGETYLIAAEAAVGLGDGATAAANINVLRVRAACDPGPANAPKLCAASHKADPTILVTAGQKI